MKFFDVIFAILLIIGGLNWGLVALANMDIVATLFGAGTQAAKIVYSLVGLSAVYNLLFWKGIRCRCAGR